MNSVFRGTFTIRIDSMIGCMDGLSKNDHVIIPIIHTMQ